MLFTLIKVSSDETSSLNNSNASNYELPIIVLQRLGFIDMVKIWIRLEWEKWRNWAEVLIDW